MKAAVAFKALAALEAVVKTREVTIPHSLWMIAMEAEIALRYALASEGLEVSVSEEPVQVPA